MAAILHSRAGDSQSLKACIAAAFSGTALEFKRASCLANVPSSLGIFCQRVLIISSGAQITYANAMAELLGETALCPVNACFKIHDWIEWEESKLYPAVLLSKPKQLEAVLARLDAALSANSYLLGDVPTLADIVVFSTLLPIGESPTLSKHIKEYLSRMQGLAPVQSGIEKVLAGEPFSELSSVAAEDTAIRKKKEPILPVPGERNILITSALPYVNNVPHLGNIIGCVLSADVYARFCRARGYNTIYICGTDEYGTATETKAYEEGITCQEVCDKYHALHKAIYDWFDISCDKFGRTPTRHQTKICQDIFHSLGKQGQLIEEDIQQLYSEALGKFLNDRLVAGTCPKCSYEDARGDQCDKCGSLLNSTELINPKCSLTGTKPLLRTTRHIFLDLPKLTQQLQAYIDTTSELGGWSTNCVQVTRAWMRDGLKPRCITRDLKWGTPVPRDGFRDKVFYVWFDAPIGYLSITASYTPEWEKWWKNPKDVEMVQFMGKDNVPFHTVIFPATLLGTGEDWTMMRNISVTEYLNYEGGKFSKSRSTGVFGNDAMDTGIPVEIWRYYLLANRPEQQDTDFMWDNLAAHNNNELLKNLGNFVNRSLKFVEKFFDRIVPEPSDQGQDVVAALGKELVEKTKDYISKLEKIQIRSALFAAMDISSTGNKFLQDNKAWELVKDNEPLCRTLIATGVGVTKLLAALMQPFMPSFSKKVLDQLNLGWEEAITLTDEAVDLIAAPDKLVPAGHKINEPGPLFARRTDEEIQEFKDRFKGPQVTEAKDSADKKGKGKQKGSASQPREKGGGNAGKDKEKKGKKEGSAPAADKPVDISRVDLRVGVIRKAWKHPDAESLYVEEADLGEEQPRTVISGLVKFIPVEEMQNRRVVFVCNMKPVNMRGIKSQAMVLAASSPDGNSVELVEPPEGVPLGESVTVAGFEGEPDGVLNPKKKIFESVKPDLATNSELVACYKGVPLSTSKGVCTVKSIAGGSIG